MFVNFDIMNTDNIASKHLGKISSGSEYYDSSLLVAVPREENRLCYNINSKDLPFCGFDIWHGYEFSCLTEKGLPVTRVLKIKYSCENDYIIESKSLKLYLNSFNMIRYGKDTTQCLKLCKQIIEKDLSNTLAVNVEINFINTQKITGIYSDFTNIMNFADENEIYINDYKENYKLLQINELKYEKTYKLKFDSLRSNCRVTHQPDFGDVFIYYKSKKHIDENSLVKYLTSFRSEYHFHEECCEMIYKRLYDLLNYDDELFVSCLYTRRGGIDICPVRWSKNFQPEFVKNLLDVKIFARNGIKQ